MPAIRGVVSVDAMRTPVLGLVVRRDEEIENFVAKDFFEVRRIVTPADERFTAIWQPARRAETYRDEGALASSSAGGACSEPNQRSARAGNQL